MEAQSQKACCPKSCQRGEILGPAPVSKGFPVPRSGQVLWKNFQCDIKARASGTLLEAAVPQRAPQHRMRLFHTK